MIDIQTALYNLMHARYGQQVRQSLHDAVYQINENANEALQTAKAMGVGTAVTSASSSSTGYVAGNLYLNNSTWDLWQCIGTNSWLNCGNVKGAQGNRGTDGTSYYVYIRYSPNYDGTDFTASPTASSQYVGFYSGTSATAPTNKQDYAWTSYVGASGTSAYVHIMYSENADGSNFVSTPTANTKYIGFYSGTASSAPANKSLYTWSEYVGRSGTGTGDMLKSEFAGSGVVGAVDRALTADSATDSTNASNLKKSDNTTVSADDITAKLSRLDDNDDYLALQGNLIDTKNIGKAWETTPNASAITVYAPVKPNTVYSMSAYGCLNSLFDDIVYVQISSIGSATPIAYANFRSSTVQREKIENVTTDSTTHYIAIQFAISSGATATESMFSQIRCAVEERSTCSDDRLPNTKLTETLSTYSNPNLLDNPCFTINSKGQATYTGTDIVCVDKWNVNGTATTSSDGITLDNALSFYQILTPILDSLKGKTVTVSAIFDVITEGTNAGFGLISSDAWILFNTFNSVGTNKIIKTVFTIPTTATDLKINVYSPGKVKIHALKVEIGNVCTIETENSAYDGFTPRTITNELPRWEQEKTVSGVGEQTVIFTVDTSRAYELWFNTPYGSQCSIVSSTLSGTTLTYVVNIPSNEAGTKVRLRSSI